MQFHILSFEGPDAYARAGGIASRVTGLAEALIERSLETHLWFVGDPVLPGHEIRDGLFHLHRWCQWISAYHPSGVYDGQEGKVFDYGRSLPTYLLARMSPGLLAGNGAVVLAEEWHTVDAVLRLDQLLHEAGLRQNVHILWNANNTFGFDRIPWQRLASAATITTVSRYMRQWMREHVGVDAVVIPNGLGDEAYRCVDPAGVKAFQRRTRGRQILTKVARFDPDKRWLMAIEVAHRLRHHRQRPLLVARGGLEAHGREVLERAKTLGLRVQHRRFESGVRGVLDGLEDIREVDMIVVDSPLGSEAKRLLYRASSAVLVNSAHEPFGLVGLEAMAAGGVACTGCSGEDYAVPGINALVMQTDDPAECVQSLSELSANPNRARAIRREARRTARVFSWPKVLNRHLLPTATRSTPTE